MKILAAIAAAVLTIKIVDLLAFIAVRLWYHFGDHFGYVQMADPLVEEFIEHTVRAIYEFVAG